MLDRWLFKRIDNAPLIVFRFFFGFLIMCESFGAILTGWVKRTLIDPQFTFSFIGFEWLQPLPGFGMYLYFSIMGCLGLCITLGYKYRFSMVSFALLWTAVYLMQKTSYNNHYYLLVLTSWIMCFFPADKAYSLAVRKNPEFRKNYMYAYVKWVIVIQLFLVYTYASVAKLYADWLDFGFIKLLLSGKADYYVIGPLLQQPWLHSAVGIFGIAFDLLIVPAMLWKPTRKIAFGLAVFFHLFNSIVFQIGIFPFMAIAFMVFFFEPKSIRRIFLRTSRAYETNAIIVPANKKIVLIFASTYLLIQFALPLRHYFFKDNVLWTEEGHRLSWRMMLRSRSGRVKFKVVDKKTQSVTPINLDDYLTKKQKRRVGAYPDFIWQFAQRLKKEYAKKGIEVAVYVDSKMSINGKPYKTFIAADTDLAQCEWKHFSHNEWILPSDYR